MRGRVFSAVQVADGGGGSTTLNTIKHVHFSVQLKPQGNLLLVELENGQFCIVHNDRLLDDRCWARDQGGRAVAAYLKMKAELTGET